LSFQIWTIFYDYDPEGIDSISILLNPVNPAHKIAQVQAQWM